MKKQCIKQVVHPALLPSIVSSRQWTVVMRPQTFTHLRCYLSAAAVLLPSTRCRRCVAMHTCGPWTLDPSLQRRCISQHWVWGCRGFICGHFQVVNLFLHRLRRIFDDQWVNEDKEGWCVSVCVLQGWWVSEVQATHTEYQVRMMRWLKVKWEWQDVELKEGTRTPSGQTEEQCE